ncbi:hypothetical protein M8494_14730 [Serratia ureilytica]
MNMIRTGQGNKARYHLIGVNERFYELGEVNFRPAGKKTRPDKTLWHFNPVELRFCYMHKMFDQALAVCVGGLADVRFIPARLLHLPRRYSAAVPARAV